MSKFFNKVWHKAEFKNARGTFYACRWDKEEQVYILRPFGGGKEMRMTEKHVDGEIQMLGFISRKSAKERGITHILHGGYFSPLHG